MYAWIVQYRRNTSDEFRISSEAYWSMEDAELFIKGRANSPKPVRTDGCKLCHQYKTDKCEEYLITEVHLPKKEV